MSFRNWIELLRAVRGPRPLWPVLLGAALDAEFRRQLEVDDGYVSEVFIDRDSHPLEEGEREERLVASLYRACHGAADGCVTLDDRRIWLLGYQWPNQGRERGRRADLVGLTVEGSVVVFEAKRHDGEAPTVALVEGLDYLACLLRPKNFGKIMEGFDRWRVKPARIIPAGFENTIPQRTARPLLVVLGPSDYYSETHSRSERSKHWPSIMAVGQTMMPSVEIRFAATDFKSPQLVPAKPSS